MMFEFIQGLDSRLSVLVTRGAYESRRSRVEVVKKVTISFTVCVVHFSLKDDKFFTMAIFSSPCLYF